MNKYRPHLYILPEDERNRQIAQGFLLHPAVIANSVKLMPPSGGWPRVRDLLQDEYAGLLRRYNDGHLLLLIDFDGDPVARTAQFTSHIPTDLESRIFVVGSRSTPEKLKSILLAPYERIGEELANDCVKNREGGWGHDELQHNESERRRMISIIRPFMFEE